MLGEERLRRQLAVRRLGDAEVDDLGTGTPSCIVTSTFERLDVAVDDALLVRVLDGVADVREELEARLRVEALPVAVLDDRDALDVLHHEVRAARLGARPRRAPSRCCGWSIIASAWRSASKRAITCFVSMPSLMILKATRRLTGSRCSAIQIVPKPPSPIFSSSL